MSMADQTEDEKKQHWLWKSVVIAMTIVVLYLLSPPLLLSVTSNDLVIMTAYEPVFMACEQSKSVNEFYSWYIGLFPLGYQLAWLFAQVTDEPVRSETFIGYPPAPVLTDP